MTAVSYVIWGMSDSMNQPSKSINRGVTAGLAAIGIALGAFGFGRAICISKVTDTSNGGSYDYG